AHLVARAARSRSIRHRWARRCRPAVVPRSRTPPACPARPRAARRTRAARTRRTGRWSATPNATRSWPATEDDVELVAERPLGHGTREVEACYQLRARRLVGDRLVYRIDLQQRIAGEVHLGDQPLAEVVPEQGKMDVRGPPGVGVVLPRVGARLDGDEVVAPLAVGDAETGAGKVRIQRRRVLVGRVVVAAARVRLPHLDQGAGQWPAVAVQHLPADDGPLAQRTARRLVRQG